MTKVHAGDGNHVIYGQGGNDRLYGEGGVNLTNGGSGTDGCATAETRLSCER